jgi:5-methylcytosine-specific restriction endonuclease McrA
MYQYPERLCDYCHKPFTMRNTKQRFCSSDCRQADYEISYAKGTYLILERDKFKCIYCGKSSIEDGIRLHIDHIKPRVSGGKDIAGNLVTACEEHNTQKSAKELPDDCLERIVNEVHNRNVITGISDNQLIKLF